MNFEDLTPEQLEKANACTNAEELLKLAAEEGIELTDAQMEAITGGTAFTAGTYNFNHGLWGRVTD